VYHLAEWIVKISFNLFCPHYFFIYRGVPQSSRCFADNCFWKQLF